MKKGLLLAFVAFCALLVAALAGCGGSGGGSNSGGQGTATLKITWPERTRLIPVASESITAAFYNARTLVATQTVARPTTGNTSNLSFTGLPATTLTFTASAYPEEDGSGTPQASVTASVRVTADQTTNLSVTMLSTIDKIVMTPTTASVTVGGTRTLIATPVTGDDDAVLVSDATTSWSSSDTDVATVSDAGIVTGVSNGTATITFTESESGKTGTVVLTVGTGGGGGNDHIIDLANAYLDSLDDDQKADTLVSADAVNAAKWSGLAATPDSNGVNALRNGVAFSTLTAAQKLAWTNLVETVLGTEGTAQLTQNRRAEEYLGTTNSGYDDDYVYAAFVGTPATTGSWILQVGGHHFAQNYTFSGSTLQSTTPYLLGVEPASFILNGTTYVPMDAQRSAMVSLLGSLSNTQANAAFLGGTITDLVLGAGKDARSNFPTGTTGRGMLASNLNASQKTMLRNAIAAWTNDSAKGTDYYDLYSSELDQTYVAFSGTTNLTNHGDYVRIDGPHVWIELVCRNGEVQGSVHYHSIWRDRVTDYNSVYTF